MFNFFIPEQKMICPNQYQRLLSMSHRESKKYHSILMSVWNPKEKSPKIVWNSKEKKSKRNFFFHYLIQKRNGKAASKL